MNMATAINEVPLTVIKPPERTGWVARLDPVGYASWCPPESAVPNRFHRFMQRLFFGIRWERVE